ncbi:MAG: phosphomevalonate kinase [Sporolactobacillus sp.]|nr:phosphomevalonate kinase [Sporolactobacillus sp.]
MNESAMAATAAPLARAPGKLYIAGEYAVVEPGFPAIIAAVNRYVTVKVKQREESGRIVTENSRLFPLEWTRRDGRPDVDERNHPFRFILSAIRHTEAYVHRAGRPLTYYQVAVGSDLDRVDRQKYGLGSSAAVTVATVRALLAYYHVTADPQLVFKLAALSHLSVQRNGSCGDIAASVYGGWLAYTSFDRNWLARQTDAGKVPAELLGADWPGLSMCPLEAPPDLRLLVGWTGQPASTYRLVKAITAAKSRRPDAYRRFLYASRACVERMIAGFRQQCPEAICREIRHNRRILADLSALSGVAIETDELRRLCELAEEQGAAAKSSGAGGGDCGIVLAGPETDSRKIEKSWSQAGITPLNLRVTHPRGKKAEGNE